MIPALNLGIKQRDAEVIGFRVDESETGNDALPEGKYHGTFTKNGTGDYTITLRKPAQRTVQLLGAPVPLTANLQPQLVSIDTSAIRVKFTNNSGTATNTDFHFACIAHRCSKQY